MTGELDQLESRQLLTTGFQLVTSVSGLTPAAVAAISPTDVVAVGSGTLANGDTGALIETFNGTTWSAATVPSEGDGTLDSVAASSTSDVFAVGETLSNGVFTPLVEFFNGTTWSIQTTPALASNGSGDDTAGGGELFGVTAISPTDVWAVGGLGNGRGGQLIEHFNGTSWSVVASPDAGDDGTLVSISAANANDIFAVGSVGKGEHPSAAALQFNGTTWSAVANGPTGTHSVDAISATDVWAVGGAGGSTGAAVWNFDGTTWTEVATVDGQLTAVSGSLSNDVYVVGEGDLVEQWNGTSFNVVSATGTAGFNGVATLSNGTAIAVGGNGIETNATTAAPAVSVAAVHPAATSTAQTTAAAVTTVHTVQPSVTTAAQPSVSVAVGVVPSDSDPLSASAPNRRR